MAIVQISKLQQRAGNLVDLPQLDNGELGWATDANRLFIGRGGTVYTSENVEVLTSYSAISLSQLTGSEGGNLNITAAENGQLLAYVSSTDSWENYTGNSNQLGGGKLKLGNVANVNMGGGAAGYVLQTDGTGNLSWTAQTGGGGGGGVGGSNTSIQFNDSGLSNGVAAFTFNKNTTTLTIVSGNANVGNLNSTAIVTATRLISNIATGTSPLVVTSTTTVANLAAATATTATTAGTVTTAAQPNITSVGTLLNTTLGASNSFSGGNLVSATYLTGTLTTAAQPNITSVGTLANLTVTGNISGGNVSGIIRPTIGTGDNGIVFPADPGGGSGDLATIQYYVVTGETTVLELKVANDISDTIKINAAGGTTITNTLTTTSISAGANTTAGTITGTWTLSAGSTLNATYADLAEYYESDAAYEPGTVLEFGGDKEVTIAKDSTIRVAGVVSTNPAYVMNAMCVSEYTVAIALQGRVPCKVRGTIRKGDMLISAGGGFARPAPFPVMGTVIGKSLQDFDGEGVIEVAVGRL